ncbi:hypothetical protein KIN20_003289 [Parelaphostrongylus tenuis]|uniref:Uncharacterized protein n=1 Tax=Parelaphostrongylus tenuis TaxID=148309 RepID=A0AAD5QII3_PARTN|nr:hypothetical protein KIN20_003289 [Parelaphostrongylus tenuis]
MVTIRIITITMITTTMITITNFTIVTITSTIISVTIISITIIYQGTDVILGVRARAEPHTPSGSSGPQQELRAQKSRLFNKHFKLDKDHFCTSIEMYVLRFSYSRQKEKAFLE